VKGEKEKKAESNISFVIDEKREARKKRGGWRGKEEKRRNQLASLRGRKGGEGLPSNIKREGGISKKGINGRGKRGGGGIYDTCRKEKGGKDAPHLSSKGKGKSDVEGGGKRNLEWKKRREKGGGERSAS